MMRKSIISWFDVIKLALGIMVGVTPMLFVFMNYSEKESKKEKKDITPPKIEIEEKQDTFIVEEYDEYYEKYYKENHTIDDIIEMREELRYALWIDSVYLSIPEDVLRTVLAEVGTELETQEIVEEYLKNKKKYHQFIK